MTANGTFAVHSLDHARLSARKFAQQHVFPHISAAFPIWRPRMFLSSAIHDKPPRGAGPRKAAFSRNRRKQMGGQGRRDSRRQGSGARAGRRAGICAAGDRARGRRGGSGNAAEARAARGDGGVSNCAQGRLEERRVPAGARRAPARRFGEGPRKARTSARASVGHNRARELSLPRLTRASRPTHSQTRRAPIFTLPASLIR